MGALTIRKVETKRDLTRFINFNTELYKDSPYAVPYLFQDVWNTFDRKKNAAFDFCECDWFLAERDGKLVGCVCAIINHRANERWNVRNVRFGWFDTIDDEEVVDTLIRTVEQWGKERGMTHITGPLGITDMDPEGMLVEGYEELGTMATIYNFPYYVDHMVRLGFKKETDWLERLVTVPTKENPARSEKFFRIAEIVGKRFNLRALHFKNTKQIIDEGWGLKVFHLVNRAYDSLFGFSQMTDRQCEQYVNQYIPFIDVRSIALIVNDKNELVAMGAGMPSLSHALQKGRGKLLPFGWWHLFKTLYLKQYPDTIDLLLIAVAPEYQGKGVNALIFADLIQRIGSMGFKYAEVHPVLEDNNKCGDQWDYVESRVYKRRRCWIKKIDD